MNNTFVHDGAPAFDSVESLILAAGGYVQPTDDLRPRTLEAARESCRQRRWNHRLGSLAAAVILLALCGLPHWGEASSGQQVARASWAMRSFDAHQQAARQTLGKGFDPGWTFFEAISELRRKQADLFDSAM